MNEKPQQDSPGVPPPAWAESRRHHVSRRRHLRAVALLIGLLTLGYLTHVRLEPHMPTANSPSTTLAHDDDPMNPWASITPSANLTWHPCYTFVNPRFLCARLTVPMDYTLSVADSHPHQKVHIALVLLPANNSTTSTPPTTNDDDNNTKPKPSILNPILLNPGGPGGSGTLLALLTAPAIQQILGQDRPVIGFDPRGVPATSPTADCWARPFSCGGPRSSASGAAGFSTAEGGLGFGGGGCDDDGEGEDVQRGLLHRLEWERVNSGYGLINESDTTLRFLEVGHRGVNTLCREKDRLMAGGNGGVLRWAGTQEVARDMVSIVDAWERWVDETGGQVADESLKGKLVYWGFSYGTYLGATFARMFPERVGRLLLDGVVDAEFYESPVWRESLVDTDKVLGRFFYFCAEAKNRCDLYRSGDGAADVQRRYEAVMHRLKTSPVTFTHPEHFYPVVLRVGLIKLMVFSTLYSPIQGFPVIATLLNYIYEGRNEQLGALFQDTQLLCSLTGNPILMGMMTDAQRAIMCSDKTQPMNMTLPELNGEYERMAATSQFADIWMNLMMKCNGWDIPSGHAPNPNDPWAALSHSNQDGSKRQIETANPILFLSNTYDPVTPLRAAVKMALKFQGAGLLEQESQGHCTSSAVSRCTGAIVREYVRSGKVPPPPTGVDASFRGEWTRCGADEVPWGHKGVGQLEFETAEDKKTRVAWETVQKVMGRVERWGVRERGLDAVMALQDF